MDGSRSPAPRRGQGGKTGTTGGESRKPSGTFGQLRKPEPKDAAAAQPCRHTREPFIITMMFINDTK